MSDDARLFWSAAARNRAPILEQIEPLLRDAASVLEIASGSGEHTVHFAAAAPTVTFQPSDIDARHRESIDAWAAHARLGNVRPAIDLDVTLDRWWCDLAAPDLLYCANMIHIAPWTACVGLLRGAGHLLAARGALVLYGPFLEADVETTASNLAFDESLKSRDSAWGIRALEDVDREAATFGLARETRVAMPANNLLVVYRKAAA